MLAREFLRPTEDVTLGVRRSAGHTSGLAADDCKCTIVSASPCKTGAEVKLTQANIFPPEAGTARTKRQG